MGYHRQLQIKENGKTIIEVSEKEKRRRKIKQLQRYCKKICNASKEELPLILQKFYSYVIKKSIITDETYIKEKMMLIIDEISDSYKNDYDPMDCITVSNYMQAYLTFNNFRHLPKDYMNAVVKRLNVSFHAAKLVLNKYFK